MDLHDDLAAALADRYQVERELGHGGMAVVYLARDVKHSRHVAVKVLRPDLASSIGGERFLREIDVAARLTHPNILTLHDSGSADGGALLYYVMPYVEGETLRARLDREHQLPVDEALAITRQVAAALDYAHARGVVHRDVKPENILLTGEHACVADFGLARALYAASTRRLTESAVAVGTPAYMSPEQAAADPEVDGRADVYSLGCVVFEMLAGTAPYRGATAQAVLAQHMTAPVPSICAQRPHCPAAVDTAVQRAMEKIPADRFRTAGEMVRAMVAAPSSAALAARAHRSADVRSIRWRPILGAVVLAIALAAVVAMSRRWLRDDAPPDPQTYVVLPFGGVGSAGGGSFGERVSEALSEWDGINVVDPRVVADAIGKRRDANFTAKDVAGVGRAVRARWAVWGDASRDADSLVLRSTLYDVAADSVLRTAKVVVAARGPTVQQLRRLTNELLRPGSTLPWASDSDSRRPSLPAWLAYDRAQRALTRWDIETARHELATAATDEDFARAQLWLSLVRMWAGEPGDAWRGPARRAVELRARLPAMEATLADAQLALAEDRFPEACKGYAKLLPLDTTGVIAWFGLGECQFRDSMVVRDRRAPGGYRFRSSIEGARRAYLHILEDRAPPKPAFVYARLAAVLPTAPNEMRRGHLLDGSEVFGAIPSLAPDTLAYVPIPLARFMSGSAELGSRTKMAALARNRETLGRVYAEWAREAPNSVEAHVALARTLEAEEDIALPVDAGLTAYSEIQKARALVSDGPEGTVLARTALRLLVKSEAWVMASALGDSLFRDPARAAEDTVLAGPAALTGRLQATLEIVRQHASSPGILPPAPDGRPLDVAPALARGAALMQTMALFGLCPSTLGGYPHSLDQTLESYETDSARKRVIREALLRRTLSLAAPCNGARPLRDVDAGGDPAVMMQQALASGDRERVEQVWRTIRDAREAAHFRPGDVAVDYTYLESAALAAAGDTATAIAHLDQSLDALPTLGTYFLSVPAQSAGLVRAMGLRAELARARNDRRTAARWGRAVAALWKNADTRLQPYVERMKQLGAGQ